MENRMESRRKSRILGRNWIQKTLIQRKS